MPHRRATECSVCRGKQTVPVMTTVNLVVRHRIACTDPHCFHGRYPVPCSCGGKGCSRCSTMEYHGIAGMRLHEQCGGRGCRKTDGSPAHCGGTGLWCPTRCGTCKGKGWIVQVTRYSFQVEEQESCTFCPETSPVAQGKGLVHVGDILTEQFGESVQQHSFLSRIPENVPRLMYHETHDGVEIRLTASGAAAPVREPNRNLHRKPVGKPDIPRKDRCHDSVGDSRNAGPGMHPVQPVEKPEISDSSGEHRTPQPDHADRGCSDSV